MHRFKIYKIQMCKYALINKCDRGENCTFAHDISELRIKPDMRKTKLCKSYILGKCTDHNCIYAHSVNELREVGKPAICQLHREGRCIKGNQCRFAHSINDINTKLVQFYGNEEYSNEEESSVLNINNCLNIINNGKSSILNKMKGYVDIRNENEEIMQTINKKKNEIWNLHTNINDSSSNSSILSNNLYNAMTNNKKNTVVKNMNRTNLIRQTPCNILLNDNLHSPYITEKKEGNHLNNQILKNTKLCALIMNKDQSYDYENLLLDKNNNKNYLLSQNINKLNNMENPSNGNFLNESLNQNVSSLNSQSFLSFNSPQQIKNENSNDNLNDIDIINESIDYELVRKLDNVEATFKNHVSKSNKNSVCSINLSNRDDDVIMNNLENNSNCYNSCNKKQKIIDKMNQIIANSNNVNNKSNEYILNQYFSNDANFKNDQNISRNDILESMIHNDDILNKNKKNGSTNLVYINYSMNSNMDDSNNENNYVKSLNKVSENKDLVNFYNMDESLKYFEEYLYKNDEKKNFNYSENKISNLLDDTNAMNELKKSTKENKNIEGGNMNSNKNKRENKKCLNYYENMILNGNNFDMKTLLPKLMNIDKYLKMDNEKIKNKIMDINAYLNENMDIKNSFIGKSKYVEGTNNEAENFHMQNKKKETCENLIKNNFNESSTFESMNDENKMDIIENDGKVILKKNIYQNELKEENKNMEIKEADKGQKENSEELRKSIEEIYNTEEKDEQKEKRKEKGINDVDLEKEENFNRLNKIAHETIFDYSKFENGTFNDSYEFEGKSKNTFLNYNILKNDDNKEISKNFLKSRNGVGTNLKNFEEIYFEKLNEYKNYSFNNNDSNGLFKYTDNMKIHNENIISKKKDDYANKEANNINISNNKYSNSYEDSNEINNYNFGNNDKKSINNSMEELKKKFKNISKDNNNELNMNEDNDNNSNYTSINTATTNTITDTNSNNNFMMNSNDNDLKNSDNMNMNKNVISFDQEGNLNYGESDKREHHNDFKEEKKQKLNAQNINKTCTIYNNKGNTCNSFFENNNNNYYNNDISNKNKFENKSWIDNRRYSNIINVNDVVEVINNCKKSMNTDTSRNAFNISELDINANNRILMNILQESIAKNEETVHLFNNGIKIDTGDNTTYTIKNNNSIQSNDINNSSHIKNSSNIINNNHSNTNNRNGSSNLNIKNNTNDGSYNKDRNEEPVNVFFYDDNQEKVLSNNMNCNLYEEINDLKNCNLIKNRGEEEDDNIHKCKFPKLNSLTKNKIIKTTNYIDKSIFKKNSFSNFDYLNESYTLNKEAKMHLLNERSNIMHFKDTKNLDENQNKERNSFVEKNEQNRTVFRNLDNKPCYTKENEQKICDFNLRNLSMDYIEMNNENIYLNSSSTKDLNSFRNNAETSISNNSNTANETNNNINNNNIMNKENSYMDYTVNNNKSYQTNYLNDNFGSIETIINIDVIDNLYKMNNPSNKTRFINNNNSKLNFLKNGMFLNNSNNTNFNKNALNFFDLMKTDYNNFETSTNNVSSFFNYDISKRAEIDFSNLMDNSMSSNNALNNNSCLYDIHFENKSFVNDGDCMKFSNDININFLNKNE